MKNTGTICLLLIACMMLAFVGGFFLGRNTDHAQVQISNLSTGAPVTDPSGASRATDHSDSALNFPLNINTATREQLMTLPNIGPVIADRIIAFRDKYGDFKNVLDLGKVEGIGKKTLEPLLDLVTVGG